MEVARDALLQADRLQKPDTTGDDRAQKRTHRPTGRVPDQDPDLVQVVVQRIGTLDENVARTHLGKRVPCRHRQTLSPTNDQIQLLLSALGPQSDEDAPGAPSAPARAAPAAAARSGEGTTGSTAGSSPAEPVEGLPEMDDELREAFLDDARRGLAAIEEAALALESEPANPSSIRNICRELHTLKGASASVGLQELAAYFHELEDR